MADTKKDNVSKLRIIVSAFEHKVLDKTVADILAVTQKLEVETRGPIPLPTKTKRWTVNRSTFVYEQSKEQFEMKTHRRLIDIINPNQKVMEALTNMQIPAGVNVDVKMVNKK